MKTLGIIGAGHLGQQIAHYAISDGHYENVCFFDDVNPSGTVAGYPVMGAASEVEEAFARGQFDELIIGIGYKHLSVRRELFEKHATIPFGTIVHSSTWVDPTATVKPGCVIYPGCTIDAHSVISENSVLNVSCTIAHDTVVGAHCFLSPRVAVAGFVEIGNSCIVGINATLIDNITIAPGTQIGGATVVIRSIDRAGLYVGNPHKFVR